MKAIPRRMAISYSQLKQFIVKTKGEAMGYCSIPSEYERKRINLPILTVQIKKVFDKLEDDIDSNSSNLSALKSFILYQDWDFSEEQILYIIKKFISLKKVNQIDKVRTIEEITTRDDYIKNLSLNSILEILEEYKKIFDELLEDIILNKRENLAEILLNNCTPNHFIWSLELLYESKDRKLTNEEILILIDKIFEMFNINKHTGVQIFRTKILPNEFLTKYKDYLTLVQCLRLNLDSKEFFEKNKKDSIEIMNEIISNRIKEVIPSSMLKMFDINVSFNLEETLLVYSSLGENTKELDNGDDDDYRVSNSKVDILKRLFYNGSKK